ncbi:hypothetical protein [Methylobacterium brachiatum]|nr:hypothetical protein [Methylobacterium brachiatum]SFI05220.1 hypothetical protein SAMN02799642_00546 [Methylobacterium brachiatum]
MTAPNRKIRGGCGFCAVAFAAGLMLVGHTLAFLVTFGRFLG